jgi:hypothetical protein
MSKSKKAVYAEREKAVVAAADARRLSLLPDSAATPGSSKKPKSRKQSRGK